MTADYAYNFLIIEHCTVSFSLVLIMEIWAKRHGNSCKKDKQQQKMSNSASGVDEKSSLLTN